MGAFSRKVSGGRRRRGGSDEPRLPQGAEAALWSILEAVPDPRNHLALTRDLSGEVRLTGHELDALNAAYESRVIDLTEPAAPPSPSAAPRRTSAGTPTTCDEQVVDVRTSESLVVDSYYDLGELAENAPLTDHLFTPTE